jgi:hypothetical protein
MTGQNVTRVLDAKGTLEETLNEVAPRSEEHYYEAQTYPMGYGTHRCAVVIFHIIAYYGSDNHHQNGSADAAFP